MPIGDAMLRSLARANTVIHEDRLCSKCSYNLKGLKIGDRCPECGTPISSAGVARFSDAMTDAPMQYLARITQGATVLLVGLCGILVALATNAYLAVSGPKSVHVLGSLICLALACVWTWGGWIVTMPRQTQRSPQPIEREWRTLRLLARIGLTAWIAAALFFMTAVGLHLSAINAATPISSIVFSVYVGASLALIAAAAGSFPFCLYLSLLADWAQDHGLGHRLRAAPFCFVFSLPFTLGTLVMISYAWTQGVGFFTFLVTATVAGLMFLSLGFFMWTIIQFCMLCFWAKANVSQSLDSDRRRSSNIVKRIVKAQAKPDPKPMPDIPVHKPSRPQGNVIQPEGDGSVYELTPESRDPPRT